MLVFLTGGPGEPGVPFASRLAGRLGPALRGYRLVMFDQRGTGAGALDCPALQQQMGASDLTVPSPAAVRSCAAAIGPDRRFFATADTVADIEALRVALGVARLTVDGVSYGSYVAERFALAHPGEVSRLILDSVVPSWNVDPMQLVSMRQSATVLRDACAAQRCGFDPATDLAAVVRRYHDGPALFDTLVAMSVGAPSFPGVPAALHAAAAGQPAALSALIARVHAADAATAGELSQGLHASTLCADMPMPWGGPDTPLAARPAALARAAARLTPAQVWPFDRATAAGNGFIQTCLYWPPPPRRRPRPRGPELPRIPVLLLAGGHDLSTPLAGARAQAALAPDGRLFVVPTAGHSVQYRAAGDPGGGRTRPVPRLSSIARNSVGQAQMRCSVAGSVIPSKYWSRTWRNTGSPGAACRNSVIQEHSFSASTSPNTCSAVRPRRPTRMPAHSVSRAPSTGCAR